MARQRHGVVFVGATLSAVLATSSTATADAPVRAMTLREALDYAHTHQPDLRAAAARVEAVRAAGTVTRARWYPTVTGAAEILASTTNNTTGSYVAVAGVDNPRVSATLARSASTSSLEPSPASLLAVGLRQEIFDFGRISAQEAADDLRADAQHLSLEGARLVVDEHVEEAYFAVFTAKAVVRAAENAFARAKAHRDQARAGLDAGLRRPIELTRTEALLDHYELGRIRAARNVRVAEAVLAAAVGVDDPLLDITGAPPPPRDVPALDAAFDEAEHNPDLRGALGRVRAQERQTHAVAAEERPNLFFSGALSGNAGGATPSSGSSAEARGLLPVIPNWDVGVVVAWPIFDETVRARVRQSQADEETARQEAASLHQRIRSGVEQAYSEVEAAREALPVLARALDAAVANYDQASARFNAGLGNAVEIADAEELRASAEIELAEGAFDVARARASLGRFLAEGT